MREPARLAAIDIAVPRYVLHQEDVMARAGRLLPDMDREALQRLLPVYENAGIETRRSCVPAEWYEHPHGWAEKNRLYLANAVDLIEEASKRALSRAGLTVADIDGVVSVSTSGIATPSLDALLTERMGLRRDVERLPIFGLGCAGGVIGMARAAALAMARPDAKILFVVVELCGLTFRRADHSKSNLIATALFGDGAAAAVIACGCGGPAIACWGEHTWPDSLGIMGWSVEDDGLGVVFSRDIPALTRTEFREAALAFLESKNLALQDIDEFVCHPGGAKVLDALEEAFGLEPLALGAPRAVLREYGNMSAATVMFVLERVLREGRGGRYLLSALGPGFSAAFLVMETR